MITFGVFVGERWDGEGAGTEKGGVTYVRATMISGTIFANETIKFYPRTSLASLGMVCG